MYHPIAWIATAVILGSVSCTLGGSEKVPKNVVLIVVDTLRQDHLGCYGYRRGSTPVMDALAAGGTRFTRARTAVPLTLPSFTSILTSTYPSRHGIRQNETYTLVDSVTTLAEVFRGAGFRTMAVVGSAALARRYGLDQGFETYDDEFRPAVDRSSELAALTNEYGPGSSRRAGEVVRSATEWLREKPKGRFFLFLHFFDPHLPYDAPEKLPRDEYADDELAVWAYDSEVAFLDRRLGELFGAMKKLGLIDNTLVVLTADHGEGLMDHLESDHGYFLYESTIRVPMIFSCPGYVPAGSSIDAGVRTIDLMPTLIDLMGLEVPGGLQGTSLRGPILEKTAPHPVESYFETYYGRIFLGWSELKGMEWNGWKYVQAPKPELYNLEEDPSETINLIEARPEVASDMRERFDSLISATSRPSRGMARTISMDPEHKELLQSLGYMTKVMEGDERPDTTLPDPKDMMPEYSRGQIALGRVRLAGLLIQGGRFDESLRLLDGLEMPAEREWMLHYQKGLAYLGKSDDRKAEEALLAALDCAPVGPERVRIREALSYLRAKP